MRIDLQETQAALILTIDDAGEVSVDIAAPEEESLPAAVCRVVAMKLLRDEAFQAEILREVNTQ